MTENIISFIGAFLKHVVGVLLLCWRRMLRAGIIGFAIGVTLTLLVAVIATGQAFPGMLALAVALIFGAALGYGVALTVLIEEFALGVMDIIRLVEGDAKAVAHIGETLTEREIGQIGQGLRRLIGMPVSAATRASHPAALPTLPALPKYPAASASTASASTAPGSAAQARPQRPSGVASAIVEAAATAGAAALARRATQAPTPPSATPAQPSAQAPTDEAASATTPAAPKGEPVRADRLPRIGWTYEHEAIRPARTVAPAIEAEPKPQSPADESDTLAELANVSTAAAASDAPSETPSDARVTAQTEPTTAPEPMDVSVVSATALGAHGPVAPTLMMDDAPALEDERLAEPAALTVPKDAASAAEDETPALNPAMLKPAPATTPLPQDEPPALDPLMLTPAPATTPLPQDEPPALDPAMLKPAPATTPLPQDELPASTLEAPSDQSEAEPLAAEPASAPEPTDATMDTAPDESPATDEPPMTEVPVRSAFSRVTRPVEGLASTIEAMSRGGATSAPRASAPESGLWERLSQALIDRSGAPSSPFAAPQSSRINSPESVSNEGAGETDETPQG